MVTKMLLLLCLIGSIFCADPDACSQPPDEGPCRGSITMFYFDGSTDSCKTFKYGGCLGGPNRYSSLAECEGACKS